MKRIPVTDGSFALVDDEDYPFLSQFTWSNCNYPSTSIRYVFNGLIVRETMPMHKLLIGCCLHGLVPDHINRNKMDNRRSNLRIVTRRKNGQNCTQKLKQLKGYIYSNKKCQSFKVFIGDTYIGSYKSRYIADIVRCTTVAKYKVLV